MSDFNILENLILDLLDDKDSLYEKDEDVFTPKESLLFMMNHIFNAYHNFHLTTCLENISLVETVKTNASSFKHFTMYFKINCFILLNKKEEIIESLEDLNNLSTYNETFMRLKLNLEKNTNAYINSINECNNYYLALDLKNLYNILKVTPKHCVTLIEYCEFLIRIVVFRGMEKSTEKYKETNFKLYSESLYLSMQYKKAILTHHYLMSNDKNYLPYKLIIMQNKELKNQIFLFSNKS